MSTARTYRTTLTTLTNQQVDLVGWMIVHAETISDLFLHGDIRVTAIVDALSAREVLAAEWWRDEVLAMAGGYRNAAVDILFDELGWDGNAQQPVQVELDALDPDVLRQLYADAIGELWDTAQYEAVLEAEEHDRQALLRLAEANQ